MIGYGVSLRTHSCNTLQHLGSFRGKSSDFVSLVKRRKVKRRKPEEASCQAHHPHFKNNLSLFHL